MDRIAVVEPRCWGLEHVPFNAALIAMALEAFPSARVAVHGETTHLEGLQELLGCTRGDRIHRIDWQPIEIPSRKTYGWKRLRLVRSLFAELDRRFATGHPESLIMATTDPQVLTLLKLRLWTSWRELHTAAVCHELLAVLGRARLRSTRWWGLKMSLSMPHPRGLRYVVLADSIRRSLDKVAPRMAPRVAVVEHPSLMGDVSSDIGSDRPPQLKLGFVGGGRDAKGLGAFLDLAVSVRREHPDVCFEVVGSVPGDIADRRLAHLTWTNQKLPLREFVNRLKGLSHAIWLGDPFHYRLVASGSLVDTLALGIPVVCLDGPFVDHLFRRLGDVGVRCATSREIEHEVRRLVTCFHKGPHQRIRPRLLNARAALAPEAFASQLRDALGAHTPE